MRRIGAYFDHRIDALTEAQLTDYFTDLIGTHSWTTVKLDLYGLKFYYAHVLKNPWVAPGLIKPPKSQRLPDIVTVGEVQQIIAATRVLSYQERGFSGWCCSMCCPRGFGGRVTSAFCIRTASD